MKYFYLIGVFFVTGCETFVSGKNLPQTLGEQNSTYSYVPIDPIAITTKAGDSCREFKSEQLFNATTGNVSFEALPQAFPDNTVRVAYKSISRDGTVTVGPAIASSTQKGTRYQIIIDFVNSDVVNQEFHVSKWAYPRDASGFDPVDPIRFEPFEYLDPRVFQADTVRYEITAAAEDAPTPKYKHSVVNVPVYVGVGLRVIADVVTLKGDTKLSGLGAISIAAENEDVNGSLVVQTLGINGKSITAAMPIQSDLNPTTVQNAIVAIGQIKALMYSDETTLKPRIVGIYNPLGGGEEVINAFVSELSSRRTPWYRPCVGNK